MRRTERIARAYRLGEPLPPINYAKTLGARPIFPLHAWTDASQRVYIAFAAHGGRLFAASFSRGDLARLSKVRETRQLALSKDPTMPTRTLLDLTTRSLIPSGWFKEQSDHE